MLEKKIILQFSCIHYSHAHIMKKVSQNIIILISFVAHKYSDSKLRVINLEPTNFALFPKANEATYDCNHTCDYGCGNHDDEFKNISFFHKRKGEKEKGQQNN